MKYVHGTDKKSHDLLMVWFNRFILVIILFSCFFCSGAFFLIVYWAFLGDVYGLRFLLLVVPLLVASIVAFCEGLWCNSKYILDEKGITLIYPLYKRHFPWSTFQRVYISQIRRGVGVSVAYDYIVLMISECGALTRSLSVPECFGYQDHFLIIRKTEARMTEFCKYCIFSDRPAIKAYKYFD